MNGEMYALMATANTSQKEEPTAESNQLKTAVDVEEIGDKVYKSVSLSKPDRYRVVYGGLVMSQALMAATKSVNTLHKNFLLHSFHCYFVGPTRAHPLVTYKVGHAKDGKNFCSVAVKAMQGDKVNFACMASFYDPLSSVVNYQACSMPAVPKPGESTKDTEYSLVDISESIPFRLMDVVICVGKEHRERYLAGEGVSPRGAVWVRGRGTFDSSHPQNYHRIAMVYASDFMLARMVLNKYPGLKTELVTSLDHSMWFHCPIRADQWYLYVAEAERAADGRSLTTCRVYAEDGTMVATCKQESLIRPKL